MGILGSLFNLVMRGKVRRFAADRAAPAAAQLRRLRDILAANAGAEFGRRHGFAALSGWDDYRHAVPIRPYEGFAAEIERMKNGERGVLVAEPLELFATTSGTSSAPKFCPVTRRFTLEHHLTHQLWMHALYRDHPRLLGGKFFTVFSPAVEGLTPGGVPYGSSSGRQYRNQAVPIRRQHALPYEVCLVKDYEARYHAMLVFALGADLSVVTSVNPSTLTVLADFLSRRAEPLLDDLAAGRLAHAGEIEPELRAGLERRLRPERQRAAELAAQVRATGALLPRLAWPNLKVIVTWQGGSAPFHLARLSPTWGDCPRRCLGLRASEGTFSVPLADGTPEGVLAVGGHALEFLPEGTEPRSDSPTLLAHELDRGRRYRLIVTTSGGFYRYDLADIVEVIGFDSATPTVAFLHKAGNVLSLTGEKVTEDQVVEAMRRVESEFPAVCGFTVTLELTEQPRYVLAVELEAGAPEDAPAGAILEKFETALRAANPEYRAKRDSGRLAFPALLLLAPGSYAAHRKALAEAGRPDGQLKPPHLARPDGPGAAEAGGCKFFAGLTVLRRLEPQ